MLYLQHLFHIFHIFTSLTNMQVNSWVQRCICVSKLMSSYRKSRTFGQQHNGKNMKKEGERWQFIFCTHHNILINIKTLFSLWRFERTITRSPFICIISLSRRTPFLFCRPTFTFTVSRSRSYKIHCFLHKQNNAY